MAELVEDMIAHLDTQGHGTAGTDLFRDDLPGDSTDASIAVITVPGVPSDGQFGSDALKYEHPRAIVQARAGREAADTARSNAYAAYRELGTVQGETVNGTFYHHVTCLHPPFKLKNDEQGRPIYSFGIEAEKEMGS